MIRVVYLGIDVGATNIRVGVVGRDGSVIRFVRGRTPRSGGREAIASSIIRMIDGLGEDLTSRIEGVGVGSIGPLNIRSGEVINTPNNPIRNFSLLEPLRRELRLPVYVVNDCVAAAWGEYLWGAGRGRENVVYITLSSGIGAGAVVDGHLLLGKDGNAHEVGHIVVDYSSRVRCGCGGLGHWEAFASGRNLSNLISELIPKLASASGEDIKDLISKYSNPKELFTLWRGGDPYSAIIVEELKRIDAAGIASVINVYDPEVLSVGGSIAINNEDFMAQVFETVKYFVTNSMPKLTLTPFKDLAVVVGAAAIAHSPPRELLRKQGLSKVH